MPPLDLAEVTQKLSGPYSRAYTLRCKETGYSQTCVVTVGG